eukprot:2202927-Pyramimonas_sp.AAC.1
MLLEPKNVLRTKTMFSEQTPDVLKQSSPSQKRSKNMSWKPQQVPRTSLGRPRGTPGRFATA